MEYPKVGCCLSPRICQKWMDTSEEIGVVIINGESNEISLMMIIIHIQ